MMTKKESEKDNINDSLLDKRTEDTKFRRKKLKIKDLKKCNELNELRDLTELVQLNYVKNKINIAKTISSTSIRTNSKILNDVLCDLSSISSEIIQPNIELSDVDKQRIDLFKARQKELRSNEIKSNRKRFVIDVSYFKTCSFFKQLFILLLSTIMILDDIFFRKGRVNCLLFCLIKFKNFN